MTLQKFRKVALFGSVLSLIMFSFQNCDIKQPKVDSISASQVIFNHPAGIVSCQACHETARPNLVGSISHPAKSDISVYTLDGTDPMDCIKCHAGAQTAGSWKKVSIVGGGDYHANATSCGSCHDAGGFADRTSLFLPSGSPADNFISASLSGGGHPGSTMMSGKDCILCHTAPGSARNAAIPDWLTGLKLTSGVHAGVTQCQDCHKAPNQFDRTNLWSSASPTVSPFFAGGHTTSSNYECSTCHNLGTDKSNWKASAYLNLPGFHASASECASCHGLGQKKARTGFYLAGPAAAVSVGTGIDQTFTLTNRGGHPSSTLLTQNGGSDCVSCHTYQTGGSFGATPTSWAWNEFNISTTFHLNSKFPSLGNWNGVGTADASANISATGRCATCHGPGQAFDRTLIVKSTHTGGAPGSIVSDCTYCHATGNQVSDWIGKSNFVHPTNYANAGNKYCFNCHVAPSRIKLPPNPATIDGLVSNRQNLAGHFGAEYPSSSNDCSSCHTIPSATVSGWTQTDTNGNVTNYPHKKINWTTGAVSNATGCTTCHYSAKQAINVYKTEGGQRSYKGDILLTNLLLSTSQNTTVTTRNGHYTGDSGSDCATCHSIPATQQKWTASHPSFTGDCNQCHVKAPTALVSRTGTHATIAAGGTCIGCHGLSTKNWADGTSMDHSGTTSCTTCHNFSGTTYTSPSSKVTGLKTPTFPVLYLSNLNETFAHDTTTNCKTCHTTPSTTATTFTNTWITFKHPQFSATKLTDVSCISCHNQAVVTKVNLGANLGSHTKTAFKNGQCGMCHYPVSNGGWSPSKSAAHATFRDSANSYSCTYCHDN